jgi:transcriptional regulator with XRE-family HTH domain
MFLLAKNYVYTLNYPMFKVSVEYMQNTLITLGKVLRDTRKMKKLTLRDVASRAGIHFTTLSALERGTVSELGIRKIQRVAETLGLELVLRPKGQRYTLDDIARERASSGLIERAMEQRTERAPDNADKSRTPQAGSLIARALKNRE